jgi:hypothetical protein
MIFVGVMIAFLQFLIAHAKKLSIFKHFAKRKKLFKIHYHEAAQKIGYVLFLARLIILFTYY